MTSILTRLDEITQNFKEKLIEKESDLLKKLEEGDFRSFEKALQESCDEFANSLTQSVIEEAVNSPELEKKAKEVAEVKRLYLRKTSVEIYIWTGSKIRIPSYYGSPKPNHTRKKRSRRRKCGPNGTGYQVLLYYWGFLGKASPGCYSLLGLLTVLCPSLDLVVKLLEQQGIKINSKTVRRIALDLGKKSMKYRVLLNLKQGENLAGKRVIISVDGGRTRIRKLKKPTTQQVDKQSIKHSKFDTPWKEPKLLVIQELQADGSMSKTSFPIYDTVLGSANAVFSLLADYLKQLNLKAADLVLFIGDGAKWIWNRTEKMFKDLGLKAGQYIEAIDYYHAVQQLYKTVEALPAKNLKEIDKSSLIEQLKNQLWNGQIAALTKRVKQLGKGNLPKVNSLVNYFAKRPKLFNYSRLKELDLPCGSGIVESAIRRIINLRFKSPSSFWLPKNVEPLMYLRGVALAGRWNHFIQNFANLRD